MRERLQATDRASGPAALARLAVGILLLTGSILLLMQGYAPPGFAGDVIRNNLDNGIDATPLFYTEVESYMPQ